MDQDLMPTPTHPENDGTLAGAFELQGLFVKHRCDPTLNIPEQVLKIKTWHAVAPQMDAPLLKPLAMSISIDFL